MDDLSQQYFVYAGKKYLFSAVVYENGHDSSVPLDNNSVERFSWSNILNDLVIKGELVYIDLYGKLDKFIDRQYAFCQVYFSQIQQQVDGEIMLESEVQDCFLKRIFLIDKINILERNGNAITYKLSLIDSTIFNFQQLITFSNYDRGPEPVFDILKACIQSAGLRVDVDSFDRVSPDVSLNYTTSGKDTLLSVIKYLMSRLFYYQKKDNSLKMLFFNELANVVQAFDVKDQNTGTQIDHVILSMMKSQLEEQLQTEQTQLGCVADIPKSKLLQSFFTNHIISYDMDANDFKDDTIEADTIFQYYDSNVELEDAVGKYSSPIGSNYKHNIRDAYWNTDMSIYSDMVNNMFRNNAVVVNVDGHLGRLPASYMTVSIDRDEQIIPPGESVELYKDQLTRYIGFEGMWIVSRVNNYVEVRAQRFRQSIFMFRNFIDIFAANV